MGLGGCLHSPCLPFTGPSTLRSGTQLDPAPALPLFRVSSALLSEAHLGTVHWLCGPFPPSGPLLPARLPKKGGGPVPALLPSRAFPAAPSRPASGRPSLFLFPDCDSCLCSQRSLSPPRGRLAPLPLPEPGSWSPGGQARPGRSAPGARQPEPCPRPWARGGGRCHHCPGRAGLPPTPQASTHLADWPTGRHAPAVGRLPLRPGLGATRPGPLQSPGSIPGPTDEGGAGAGG